MRVLLLLLLLLFAAPAIACDTSGIPVASTNVNGVANGSNDCNGTLTTVGTPQTAFTITWSVTRAAVPACVANASGGGAITVTSVSTTAITFTTASAITSGTIYYGCSLNGSVTGWTINTTNPNGSISDSLVNERINPSIFNSNPLTVYQSNDVSGQYRALTIEGDASLTKGPGMLVGGLPRIGRFQQIAANEVMASDPIMKCAWKAGPTGGGTGQFVPLGFPRIRSSNTQYNIGQVLLRDILCEGYFYYTVTTAGGTCSPNCGNAGTSCTGNGTCTSCTGPDVLGEQPGCTCTTGTAKPTAACWTNPSVPNCSGGGATFTDGTCTFSATAWPTGTYAVTDGAVTFTEDANAFSTIHNAAGYQLAADENGGEPGENASVNTGDNGTYRWALAYIYNYRLQRGNPGLGLGWDIIEGPGFYANFPGPEPKFAITSGSGGISIPGPVLSVKHVGFVNGVAGSSASDGGLVQATQPDSVGVAPQTAPTLALAAGGSLTVGQVYCFAQSWQNRASGGVTTHGPYACIRVTTGNQKIKVTAAAASFSQTPYAWEPVVVIYTSGDVYCASLNSLSNANTNSVTFDSWLDGSTAHGCQENQINDQFTLSNDPLFEVGGSSPNITTWASGLNLSPKSIVRPTNPWANRPPTPFLYNVVGVNCDANCSNCAYSPVASELTAGSEPVWAIDASLFCDGQAGGSKIQYQRAFWDSTTTSASANANAGYGATSSDEIFDRTDVNGMHVLGRTYLGQRQDVCNSESQPTCAANTEGLEWILCGTPDVKQKCVQTASGAFVWRNQRFAFGKTAVTWSASFALDTSLGDLFTTTLAGNTTITAFSNPETNHQICLEATQDATGYRAVSFPANVRVMGYYPPSPANKIDTLCFTYDGTNWRETSRALGQS